MIQYRTISCYCKSYYSRLHCNISCCLVSCIASFRNMSNGSNCATLCIIIISHIAMYPTLLPWIVVFTLSLYHNVLCCSVSYHIISYHIAFFDSTASYYMHFISFHYISFHARQHECRQSWPQSKRQSICHRLAIPQPPAGFNADGNLPICFWPSPNHSKSLKSPCCCSIHARCSSHINSIFLHLQDCMQVCSVGISQCQKCLQVEPSTCLCKRTRGLPVNGTPSQLIRMSQKGTEIT